MGYAWLRRCDPMGLILIAMWSIFPGHCLKNTGYESLKPALFLSDTQQLKACISRV